MHDETIIPGLAPEQGPGPLLRAAREQKGLSLRDVADGLNLKRSVVEALEQERYEQLPPRTFVKGYFKSYAKLVGLKEYDILAAFERSAPEQEPAALPAMSRGRDGDSLGWLKWLLLLIAIGAVLVLFYREFDDRRAPAVPPSAQEPAEAPAAEAPAAEPEFTPQAEPEQALAPVPAPEPAPAQAPRQETTPAPAADSASESAAVTAEADAGADEPVTGQLTVVLSADSWLDVRDAAGKRLFAGTARGPRTLELSGTPPLTVVIGDRSAVELRYQGEPIELRPFARGKVARLSLPLGADNPR